MSGTLTINPVTRVGGGLGVRVADDGERITDAHVMATAFRGYEPIITGRDPRDCIALASRVCGWCGGVHATSASLALEMAWGLATPPMAVALRSIAQATEAIWVHAAHLAVRAGPDYSAAVVKDTTPWVFDAAISTEARNASVHGFRTIAEIMEAMTPVTGRYWWETIPAGRRVLEMITLLYGKYPHPSVLAPGSVGSTLTIGNFTEYFTRLYRSVDYVKQVVTLWDDLLDFLAETDPRFAEQGARPASFIHAGCWDDADFYDPRWASLDENAARRLANPGVVIDGQTVATTLSAVHAGIEESVDRSFYQPWSGAGGDPDGGALPPVHPWSKVTIPAPGAPNLDGAYSWSTAPRWQGHVVESTPLGRLYLAATRPDFPPNDYIEPTGHSLRILVPKNFLPEMVVEWHVPKRINTLERLRADAYGVAFAGLCAALALLKGFELSRSGRIDVSSRFDVLDQPTAGAGLWESGRGMNAHWLRTKDGQVSTYQIIGASTWNASPRDGAGRPGPIEEALIGSPMIEQDGGGRRRGIDVLRTVHSFDPCMTCGTH